jgi:hypothetical protein
VPLGFTAYGCDSDPMYSAPIFCGSIPARSIAARPAATDMVIVSSSNPGTDFSFNSNPR